MNKTGTGSLFKTKIVATLGPASTSRERLLEMLDAGLDACRLNFSHGDLESHGRSLELIRSVAAERDVPLCVIGDLCGPKIRLGSFPDGPVELPAGQTVRIVRGEAPCRVDCLSTNLPTLVDEVQVGQRLYIDDGLVRLLVVEHGSDELVCTCTTGGTISDHKGINLPDTRLAVSALTDKDRRDLTWAIEHELDYVALSFVRQPEDLYELKRLIKQQGGGPRVIIKIEKTEALEHLDELIANTDVVLVARGDLGVETDLWRVPLLQKDIIARCQGAGVPVIVATQMLQSMVNSPMPTRAEVSDVANAIFDRTDAVMLSAETAVGHYPGQAVDLMNRIAAATEEYLTHRPPPVGPAPVTGRYRPTGAVAHAAVQAARDLGARVVAVWTATGATVRMVATHRLPMPVVGLAYDERVCRQMNLLYGVLPIRVEPMSDPAEMAQTLDRILLDRKLALVDDLVVVVTSRRPRTPGATDTTLVHRVGAREDVS
ncbi:MAG: pyruvate kinase [Phycisphaerae bacterium]|jgi:pyruvate kinase